MDLYERGAIAIFGDCRFNSFQKLAGRTNEIKGYVSKVIMIQGRVTTRNQADFNLASVSMTFVFKMPHLHVY